MKERHVVIVGGGISGLSAAFFLSQKVSQADLPLKITVLEAKDRFGGVLRTLSHEGTRMEAGADAFYAGRLENRRASLPGAGRSDAVDLCRALGLQEELCEAAPCFRKFFLLRDKKLFSIPVLSDSFSDAFRFLKSPLLNFQDKYRMLCEPFIPRRKESGDENFADFIRRRLGQGFYRKIAEPLIRGVYMADPERLSLGAMFSRLQKAEKAHGSLAGYFLKKMERQEKDQTAEFLTLKDGLEEMVRALVRELGRCDLRRSSVIKECAYDSGWKVALDRGETLRADVLCLAMNACDAAKLLSATAPDLRQELSMIPYDSIAVVNLIYKSADIPAPGLDFGFLVPAPGGRHPFSSLKWIGKTEDGKSVLTRAFISKAMLPDIFHEDDETLQQEIQLSLRKLFGIEAAPRYIRIERYPDALPQYETGHLERVARIEKVAGQYPGLYLIGNGFHGFGITDCVRGARCAADQISRDYPRPYK